MRYEPDEAPILSEVSFVLQEGERVALVGLNGTGKTTSIAKITKFILDQKKSVVIAAGDTYRAGSVEQIEEHAKRLGVRVIKHHQPETIVPMAPPMLTAKSIIIPTA